MLVKLSQQTKAFEPILVTLSGIVMPVKFMHNENALSQMLVMLSGISILVRLVQNAKAESPISVTLLGITVFAQPLISLLVPVSIIALQLSRLSYTGFLSSTVMLVKLEQPKKAHDFILVTVLGMVMLVRLIQFSNAFQPISVKPS